MPPFRGMFEYELCAAQLETDQMEPWSFQSKKSKILLGKANSLQFGKIDEVAIVERG